MISVSVAAKRKIIFGRVVRLWATLPVFEHRGRTCFFCMGQKQIERGDKKYEKSRRKLGRGEGQV